MSRDYGKLGEGEFERKTDEYEHSQNGAYRSITPPCQNRGSAKDERKLFGYARVSVGNDANNLETQRRVVADCEQGFKDVGSGASWNRPRLYRRKAALSRATG